MVLTQPELARRAVHALAHHAPQLRLLDLEATGQHSTHESHGDLVTGFEVLGAAYDLPRRPIAHVNGGDPQLVGLGVFGLLGDQANHNAIERFTGH